MARKFKTFYRLGLIQNWSWNLLWFTAPFYALLTFLYDIVLTNKWTWLWLITFVAGTALEVFLVILARKTFLPWLLSKRGAGAYAMTFAGLLNMSRNLLIAFLMLQLGLATEIDWLTRAIGGYFSGFALLFLYVSTRGSLVQHEITMKQARQLQQSLVHQRATAAETLQDENDRLLKQTRDTLMPRIDEIKNLLQSNNTRLDSINELRALVSEQVRPLSESLSKQSQKLSVAPAPQDVRKVRAQLLTDRVDLRDAIRPLPMVIFGFLTQQAIISIVDTDSHGAEPILAAGLSFLILVVFRLLIPKQKLFSRGVSLTTITLAAFLSTLPGFSIVFPHIGDLNTALLYSMTIIGPVFMSIGISNAVVLDAARADSEAQMQKDNDQLARETALFDQQVWLAKRSWGFVVHGTVQAALTAAMTRLSSAEELEAYQINMVLQDLDRAREALSKTPDINVDLTSALNSIAATWGGLCKVSWQISPRAQRALDRDSNARMCVNEIVKEAVSNAVRHGEAKQALIEIDRSDDDLLAIQVRNDGRAVPAEIEHGVGTRMLDDLTLNWSLTNNRARGAVDFKANLPIAPIGVSKP